MTAHSKQKKERRTQAERRAETRAAVLQNACTLFGQQGYENTSLEEIADAAGVTIRPIYHYFGSKEELFIAVTALMEQRIVTLLQRTVVDDPLMSAWRAFLELCQDPSFRRIVLIDSPNVLGRKRWASGPVMKAAEATFAALGDSASAPTRKMRARMLIGAFSELALTIAESEDPARWGREADSLVSRFLQALSE